MTPLPAGTLFTETQSGLDVTWTTYNITVTINGTNFPVSFNAGDTRAVVIEKVPVGATLSASATIGVPENLGYPGNAFSAATTSPITIQSGSNTITMWAQYPLECQMSSDAAGAGAAITGTAPSYYTNASSTPLPAASASYEDSSTTPATTMRFTGWSFTDGGVPGITSTSIPANVYKGKLSLYATYSECSLTITGATPPGSGGDPILLPDDTLSLTAVAEGFPAGSAVTYSWRIVPPATGTAPATVSGSGASAVVHPVAGAAGSATVEVTASNGTLSATAQLNIEVKVCLPDFTVTISPPAGYVAAKSSGTTYALANVTDTFSFTPYSAEGFPDGTTFTWTLVTTNSAGDELDNISRTTSLSTNDGVLTISPSALGLTETVVSHSGSSPDGITVSCTANNSAASTPTKVCTTPGTASAFLLYTLPAFTISVSLDTAGYNAGNSDLTGTDPLYALVNMGKDFTLTATPGSGSFPAGTEFEWTVLGTTLTGSTHKGRVITISPAAMGLTDTQGLTNSVSAAKNSPTGISISCTAKSANAVADVDGTDRTVNVYRLTIPAYKITLTPPTGIETEGSGTNIVYLATNGDLTNTSKKFTLKVEPVSSTDSFPDGTLFSWQFGSATATTATAGDDQRDELIGTMCNLTGAGATVPDSATAYTIKCTASLTGAAAPTIPAEATVKLKKKLFGSKAAPDAVGDIVFTDGTAEPYVDGMTLTDEQKDNAIAVIFDTNGMKGVGLVQGTDLAWAIRYTDGYNTNINALWCEASEWTTGSAGSTTNTFTGTTDGSGSLTTFKNAVTDYSSTNYPMWDWIENYATTAGLVGAYASNWYIPNTKELCDLYKAKDNVNSIISKTNGTQISDSEYWSSSQTQGSDNDATTVNFEQDTIPTRSKWWVYPVRAIRKFE